MNSLFGYPQIENVDSLQRKFKKDDFSWWNVLIDFEETLQSPTPENISEKFSFSPSDLIGPWSCYLPATVTWVVMNLYVKATKGLSFKPFSKLTNLLNLIRYSLEQATTKLEEKYATESEHEVLVKELFDFSGLPYPVNPETMFDVLSRLGFVITSRDGIKVEYLVAQDLPEPEKVLQFPDGWFQRLEEFVRTGSILFSYLELDEILAE